MSTDTATQWLIEDAKRQGLTLSEYERQYGLILSYEGEMPLPSPADQRIRRHENNAGLLGQEELDCLRRANRAVTLERAQTARSVIRASLDPGPSRQLPRAA